MKLRAALLRFAGVFVGSVLTTSVASSCGARSGVPDATAGEPLDGSAIQGCLGDLDCGPLDLCAPSRCVSGECMKDPPVVCDDADACTDDRCVPETGACEFTALALDEDGDGHPGPRAGFRPGDPGACGDDCDDTSAKAFPGGKETCDGVDNDCNGIVDDGASYGVGAGPPLLVSAGVDQANVGGIASGVSTFTVTFAGKRTGWRNEFSAFGPQGVTIPATDITHENTDAFTGPLAFTGKIFGTAWEDRRDRDFEIYFNRLSESGEKLGKDVRVTNAPNFSLRPDIVWTGSEFVIVWADRREGDASGRIFGQRVDSKGNLVGANIPLSDEGSDADNPHVAKSGTSLGVVWNEANDAGRRLVFRRFAVDLTAPGPGVTLTDSGASSSAIAWSLDRYVVVWDTGQATPGPVIRGAALAEDGAVLVSERDVTAPALFARSQALLPLGDRLLLAWAEYEGNGYAIYSKMIDRNLTELSPPQRVTDGTSDAVSPTLAIGQSGAVAVAFEAQSSGTFQVYATELECVAGP